MEAHSQSLIRPSMTRKTGIRIKLCPKTLTILDLLLVDDCILFCKANQTNCSKLKNLLDYFCNISGQLINYHKSVLMFSKKTTSHR